MVSSETCLKRPSDRNITLCCNVIVKGGDQIVKNVIYSYSADDTWEDVFSDLTEDSSFTCGKADTLKLKLASKLLSPESFESDFLEPIHIAIDFDKTLNELKELELRTKTANKDIFRLGLTIYLY